MHTFTIKIIFNGEDQPVLVSILLKEYTKKSIQRLLYIFGNFSIK